MGSKLSNRSFYVFFWLVIASSTPAIWNDNGHYYDVVEDASNLSWEDARDWASEQTYTDTSGQLFKGYLATIIFKG